jgi:hypothetical protein
MNRTCAIQHEPGYHRTHGETTKHVFEASEFSMPNLICRMGVEGSFDPNGCGFVFRTRERAWRVRGSGFLWIVRSSATLLSMSDKKHYVNYRNLHVNLPQTIPYTQGKTSPLLRGCRHGNRPIPGPALGARFVITRGWAGPRIWRRCRRSRLETRAGVEGA